MISSIILSNIYNREVKSFFNLLDEKRKEIIKPLNKYQKFNLCHYKKQMDDNLKDYNYENFIKTYENYKLIIKIIYNFKENNYFKPLEPIILNIETLLYFNNLIIYILLEFENLRLLLDSNHPIPSQIPKINKESINKYEQEIRKYYNRDLKKVLITLNNLIEYCVIYKHLLNTVSFYENEIIEKLYHMSCKITNFIILSEDSLNKMLN